MIQITKYLSIPERELVFTFSRCSGPGGQHVNKVNTRVTLMFDVNRSPSLSESQKNRLKNRLATRINNVGVLRIVASPYRSQKANRDAAVLRFVKLLVDALSQKPERKKTRVSLAAKKRRLQAKKRRSLIKQGRSRRMADDQ